MKSIQPDLQGPEFKMDLRLWSDDVPLAPVLATSKADVRHLHVRGQPMASDGPLARRVASRHYASVAPARGRDGVDLSDWFARTIAQINSNADLLRHLRSGEIEAIFWVAMFASRPQPAPIIGPATIAEAVGLNSRILIEDYTSCAMDGPSECPTMTWLPDVMS